MVVAVPWLLLLDLIVILLKVCGVIAFSHTILVVLVVVAIVLAVCGSPLVASRLP